MGYSGLLWVITGYYGVLSFENMDFILYVIFLAHKFRNEYYIYVVRSW